MKVLGYRMAANLLMKNDGCFVQDFALATELGGYPSYFFDTLAGKLPEDKKMIDRHHIIEEDWLMERKRASEINEDEQDDTDERADDSTGKASSAEKKPVPSAYSFFYQENLQQVRDENPTTNVARITLLLVEKWRALSYKEHAKYHKMHEDAKAESED
ncbi:high mobility group (HMG) box protein [Phytophthora cinnamomi]|uniref:high mobility group (HMG) box protein n=1 Tax=Phytophthora cinnamomi TaxID=4785 RepID=UPI00355AB307|nr:high mobility group (HMG) box protein [Phytophthora cinnamomi]